MFIFYESFGWSLVGGGLYSQGFQKCVMEFGEGKKFYFRNENHP